jgi:two-component system phosphate regulon response regulator PhoB
MNDHPSAVAADVHLTPTERRLWDALCLEPGRVYSRAELLAIAMPGTIVLPRTIDVHIRALRRKLSQAAREIETVHGVGYCLASEGGRP